MNECKCEGCVKENETKVTNAIELLKETLKNKKLNDDTSIEKRISSVLDTYENIDLQNKNNKLKEDIEKFNTITKHQQEQINSLVLDNNNLHNANCGMILEITDKDNEIEDLKTWVHNLKHNEETIKYRLTKEVNELKQRVDGQCTTIKSKDKEIEKLKESCKFFEDKANDLQKCLTTISHEDRRDYSGIFSRLKIIIQQCESKVEQQAKIIKLKDNEIKDLKSYNELSTEKRNTAERQYENKYKAYDSKIKELDDTIKNLESKNEKLQKQNMCYQDECNDLVNQFTETYDELKRLKVDNNKNNLHNKIDELRDENHKLRQEVIHERNYKETLIQNIDKCFKGYTQQLNFLDLYRKNSLYYLEDLNKFTTNIPVKVNIT